jgi:hypothetical protein
MTMVGSRRPTIVARRRRAIRLFMTVSLGAVVTVVGLGTGHPVAATGNSLRIEPAVQTVAQGGTFTAHIIQTADVPTSGASATISFDPTLLQIQAVTRGPAYEAAPVFTGATPTAITAANTTGSLVGVAAAFLPPDNVAAGEADFLDITFHAIGCGIAELGLPTGVTDAGLLDGSAATYGDALQVSTAGGSVSLCNSLRIEPAVQTVAQGGTFTAHIIQSADVPTSGASATISFDPTLLQIQAVTRGPAYEAAPVFTGATPTAITAANTTGSLVGVAAAFLPPDNVAAGEADFLDITFHAIGCGIAELGLPTGVTDAGLLDGSAATYGDALQVSTAGGSVTTCVTAMPTASPSGSPSPSPSESAAISPSPSVIATPTPTPRVTAPPIPSGNSIRLEPFYTGVVEGGGFNVRVVQRTIVASSGITVSIVFDPKLLQVVSVTRASAFGAAPIFAGATASAIAAANTSGKLNQVATAFLPPANLPAGEAEFITVAFKAIACGQSELTVPSDSTDSAILDGRAASYGIPLPVTTVKGIVQACDPKATPTPRPTATPTPQATPRPAPTATPAPVLTPAPTEDLVVVPPDTGVDPPTEEATPVAGAASPPSSAAPASPAAAQAATGAGPQDGIPVAARSAVLVGAGVFGIVIGLLVVIGMTVFVIGLMAMPFAVMRLRRRRTH